MAASDDPALTADSNPESSAGRPPAGKHKKKSGGSFWRELPILILVALGLAMIIKAFLIQAFFIPSGSMEKTLHGCTGCSGDRVLVNKLVMRFRDVQRGEIVVFSGVDSWTPEVQTVEPTNLAQRVFRNVGSAIGIAPPGEEDFIKRVIGIPGDVVQCCDVNGRVTVNGVGLNETYVYEDDRARFGPVTVPQGRLWVMGDHRRFSADSRAHTADPGGGTIAESHVIGRAFVKVWPPSRIGTLPVPDTFDQAKLQRASGTAAAAAPSALGVLGVAPIGLYRHRRRRRLAVAAAGS